MKITVHNLRRLIREALDDEQTPSEAMFYSILNNLSAANEGYLPVTHEAELKNLDSIKKTGIKNLDHGIYLFVGWHNEPRWITSGKGAIIQARIPLNKVRYVVPDDMYGTDGFDDFLADYPDVEGGEVGYSGELIPPRDIVKIITP
jgi:hypothetical protein